MLGGEVGGKKFDKLRVWSSWSLLWRRGAALRQRECKRWEEIWRRQTDRQTEMGRGT